MLLLHCVRDCAVLFADAIRSFCAAAVEELLRHGGVNVQTLQDQ